MHLAIWHDQKRYLSYLLEQSYGERWINEKDMVIFLCFSLENSGEEWRNSDFSLIFQKGYRNLQIVVGPRSHIEYAK